jgi:hypothetical protein
VTLRLESGECVVGARTSVGHSVRAITFMAVMAPVCVGYEGEGCASGLVAQAPSAGQLFAFADGPGDRAVNRGRPASDRCVDGASRLEFHGPKQSDVLYVRLAHELGQDVH